jgi:DNA-binding beta-propeller fold protein YncE
MPGATLWTRRYDGPADSDDGATSVVVTPDGATVFVTGGGTGMASGYDFTTIAYRAATGGTRWTRRYNGPGDGFDQPTSIGVSPDGSAVFVTGASRGSGSRLDYATVAYEASTGARLWVKRYDGPGHGIDYATALAVSPDGARVFVTGYSPGSGSGDDYATIAYRSATGATIWKRRYDGPGDAGDQARAIAVSPNGAKVFVTGGSVGSSSGEDYATLAYRAGTGATSWTRRYNGPGKDGDYAHALKVSPDGSTVFVTGESIGSDGGWDYATQAYNATTSAVRWTKRYDGTVQRDDYATALGVSPDGSSVFVTGFSVGSAYRFDYATVAYDASTGARLWVKRYDGPGHDTDDANAVAVSPDSSTVVVTGASIGSAGFVDYATVAYDASSGAEQWARRYDGPADGHDYAYAVAIGPAGNAAFVTGESTAANGFLDVATVAYSLS